MGEFNCPFCNEGTKPIPHSKGDHLVIAKCEACEMMLFFVFSKHAKVWRFRNYEIPKEKKGEA